VYLARGGLDRVAIEYPANDKDCLIGAKWLDTKALPSLWVGAIA
jgi:hypothetical protein